MNYIQEQKYPCYYPGTYCPPNKMHLNTVHWLLSKPEIGHINIVVGKDNPNESLTQDQKCKLWEMLLKSKFSAQATVHKAENGPISEIYDIFNKKRQESAFIALHEKAGRDKRFQKKFDTFPNYGIQILPSQFEDSSKKLLSHIQNKDRAHVRHHLPEDFSDEMVDEYMNICNTKPIQADTQANTPLLNYKDYHNKMFGNGFWSNVFQPMAESMLNESSGDNLKEVSEIFKSNPELANAVYKALGFETKSLNTLNDLPTLIKNLKEAGFNVNERQSIENTVKKLKQGLDVILLEDGLQGGRLSYDEDTELLHLWFTNELEKKDNDLRLKAEKIFNGQITLQQKQQAQQLYSRYLDQGGDKQDIVGFKKYVTSSKIKH